MDTSFLWWNYARMDGGDLNEVMIFTRVVEAQGFTAAARALGVPKSTVSRKVAELEQRLGVPLLVRTTRSLHLTEPGSLYYERCARIVAELDDAERAVRDLRATPKGTLRVTAPVDFALLRLGEVVTAFTRKYPEVDLVLGLTPRRVDIVAEGYDLALRAGVLTDSSLVARKLVDDMIVLVASPSYLKRRGTPQTPAELAAHDCIVYGKEPRTVWKLQSGGRTTELRIKARICADEFGFVQLAAISGGGIAMAPLFACEHELGRKQLVRVLPDYNLGGGSLFVVYPSARSLSAAARAFVEMISEWIAQRTATPACAELIAPLRGRRRGARTAGG
jgi:DNA-binding transcriptional LysR family regulator